MVERDAPGKLADETVLVFELRNPDFNTAVNIADAINQYTQQRYGIKVAKENDLRTVAMTRPFFLSPARFIAEVGELVVQADAPARVVIDERTGTIVIGKDVQISTVAVAHGNLTVRVTENSKVSQPLPFSRGETVVTPDTQIDVEQKGANLAIVRGTNLQTLVAGLNRIGLKPPGHHRHPAGDQIGRCTPGRPGGAMTETGKARRPTSSVIACAMLLAAAVGTLAVAGTVTRLPSKAGSRRCRPGPLPPKHPCVPSVRTAGRRSSPRRCPWRLSRRRSSRERCLTSARALRPRQRRVRPRAWRRGPSREPRADDYCANIANPAADARFAWQKKTLADMEQEIAKRIALLEEKTAEYQKWLARRDEFSKKANETVLRIYARMRPDAAAVQLAALDEETAACRPDQARAARGQPDPQRDGVRPRLSA